MCTNLGKFGEIYENFRKIYNLENCVNIEKFWKIVENLGKHWGNLEQIWKYTSREFMCIWKDLDEFSKI